jgi:hypothetical protein
MQGGLKSFPVGKQWSGKVLPPTPMCLIQTHPSAGNTFCTFIFATITIGKDPKVAA